MADKIQLLLEGQRRGILNERQKTLLFEAKRRGLVSIADSATPQSLEMTNRAQAELEALKPAAQPPMSGTDANIATFSQGALQGYGDEMIGGIEALRSGFEPGVYTASRDSARKMIEEAEAAATPGVKLAGNLTTAVPAAIATGGSSLPAVMGIGAVEGGVNAYGETAENDLQAVKDVGTGTALGGLFGAFGYGAGKVIEKLIPKGLAASTIQSALAGKPGELILRMRQLGASAAESDEVMREVLRQQASKNSVAATAALEPARRRLADVNKQVIDRIDNLISPENVSKFTKRTQDATRATVRPGYDAVEANPARFALTPDLAKQPVVQEAMEAAKELARLKGQGFDPNDLNVQDLDVMQRFLRLSKDKAFEGNALETLKGEIYGGARKEINDLATDISPELAASQRAVATQKQVEEATKLGTAALNTNKEAIEVAEEFANLSPEAQEGYRAAFATRLRSWLAATKGAKGTKANASTVLDKPGVAEKMKALGFPEAEIDAILERGAGARGVLDALTGGSQTARLTAAAKASESPLSQLTGSDLTAGALVHPSAVVALPAARSAGSASERAAAKAVIDALTSQDPAVLQGLMRRRVKPNIGLMSGALGAGLMDPSRKWLEQ
jgi:hypothetical protein